MSIMEDIKAVKKEIEDIKETGTIPNANDGAIATEVIKLLKASVKRLYILLLILLVMFVISIIDSFYQRHVIIDILEDMEVVEETVTETIQVDQESGDNSNNNFLNGNNNEVNN